jgi:hypothetical protein
VLMSRCAAIYAGKSSAFALVASQLADQSLRDPGTFFSRAEQVEIIQDDLFRQGRADAYPRLQTAFALWTAAHLARDDKRRALGLLDQAIALDPENGFYRLRRASHLYDLGRDAEGETAMRDLLTAGGEAADTARSNALRALLDRGRSGAYSQAADHKIFALAAARGLPLATHLLSHVKRHAAGKRVRDWAPLTST